MELDEIQYQLLKDFAYESGTYGGALTEDAVNALKQLTERGLMAYDLSAGGAYYMRTTAEGRRVYQRECFRRRMDSGLAPSLGSPLEEIKTIMPVLEEMKCSVSFARLDLHIRCEKLTEMERCELHNALRVLVRELYWLHTENKELSQQNERSLNEN